MMGGTDMTEHKFVVQLVCHLSDKPAALSQYAFRTRKEAEEYRDLALYAMKLNYGDDQTMFNFEIFEQYSFL